MDPDEGAGADRADAGIRVSVACSVDANAAVEVGVVVARGTTVLGAIRASGLLERFASVDLSTRAVGVWGRPCALAAPLAGGERVEIYRPLAMDPKEARRQRAGGQGGSPGRRVGTLRR